MASHHLAIILIVSGVAAVSSQLSRPGTLPQNGSNDALQLLNVFSALHDPVVGRVRVFMELHPVQRCSDISVCRFPDTKLPDQPAVPLSPFGKYQADDIVAPVVPEEAPLSLRQDWLAYHEAMGVEGFHLYIARTDSRHKEMFGRGRAGPPRVTLTAHHLVAYHEYYITRSDVPSRYYSQFLAVNECVYRHRHLYDYIAIIDRDEFIQVHSAAEPRQANLTAVLHAALDGTNHASASMFTGRYSVQCGPAPRRLVGPPLVAVPGHMRAEAEEHQGYAGYDVFAADPRMPDFTNCTSHPERTHLHRQCHTKSIVRPALVELQHAHQVIAAAPGYTEVPLELQRAGVYLKHVQCIRKGSDWTVEGPLCQRAGPVDHAADAGDGVDVCPQDGTAPLLPLNAAPARLAAA